jgi:hypothetical protein
LLVLHDIAQCDDVTNVETARSYLLRCQPLIASADSVVLRRQVAVAGMTTACKCHGVSGSCSVKTCWKAMQDARSVGNELMKNYIVAVEVAYQRVSRRSRDRTLVPVAHTGRTNFTNDDLIFFTQSPDYCLPEASLGSVGTTDR